MNLLFIRTAYGHWGKFSGYHQFIPQLPSEAKVELMEAHKDRQSFSRPYAVARKLTNRIFAQRKPGYDLGDFFLERRILRHLQERETEVVHFLDGEHTFLRTPALLRKHLPSRRPRVIVSFHQPVPLLERVLKNVDISSIDEVVCIAPSQVPFFEQWVPKEHIHCIPLSIDATAFQPAGQAEDDDDRIILLTVGHYLRDFDCLREVAAQCLGDKSIEFRAITHRVDASSLPDNVTLLRNLSDAELQQEYHHCSAVFMPFQDATANCAILEAMASGCPILATELPDVAHYTGQDCALTFQNNDLPDILAKIERLRNPGLRRHMGETARARACELSWESFVQQIWQLYQ